MEKKEKYNLFGHFVCGFYVLRIYIPFVCLLSTSISFKREV
ncbi:unnamed protein product [Spirodela intermedia]|uniref:Uncharacterized protein n=1 Tax=Spirodela intermedia TaxID=51605 RepID=A0A7I8JDC8_SPIIN|nr:unnamed protein product [Spirodela intermedia]CAA6668156.1 unnamed protein product [Spirodela intermedia]